MSCLVDDLPGPVSQNRAKTVVTTIFSELWPGPGATPVPWPRWQQRITDCIPIAVGNVQTASRKFTAIAKQAEF